MRDLEANKKEYDARQKPFQGKFPAQVLAEAASAMASDPFVPEQIRSYLVQTLDAAQVSGVLLDATRILVPGVPQSLVEQCYNEMRLNCACANIC